MTLLQRVILTAAIVGCASYWAISCSIDDSSVPLTERLNASLAFVKSADGSISFHDLCDHICVVRDLARNDTDAVNIVLELLPENSTLYRDRIRSEVELLRGSLLVALSEIGATSAAMPAVLAELETTKDPFTFGAACRVVQALGHQGSPATKYLLRPFGRSINDERFSLEDVTQTLPLKAPTTAQEEALKAIAAIGPDAAPALATLSAISFDRITSDVCDQKVLRSLATQAMHNITCDSLQRHCCNCDNSNESVAVAKWIPVPDRVQLAANDLTLIDECGTQRRFHELTGKPIFLSYFYTRCDNPQKCSRTVTTVAQLQNQVEDSGLAGKILIVLVTLDPVFDDALRIRQYGHERGFDTNSDNLIVRTTPSDLETLCQSLALPVSLNNGTLSIHGIGGLLLDKHGRVAKRYEAVLWSNDEVIRDLRLLCNE